jgi:hypothetical protein
LTTGIRYQATAENTSGSRKRQDKIDQNGTTEFTIGSAAAQAANKEFHDTRTLNNTTENLDLSGALTNGIGESIVFTKVRSFYAKNLETSVSNVKFDTDVANGANTLFDAFTLAPGERVLFEWPTLAGKAITAATADLIRATTTGNCQYEIGIAGE